MRWFYPIKHVFIDKKRLYHETENPNFVFPLKSGSRTGNDLKVCAIKHLIWSITWPSTRSIIFTLIGALQRHHVTGRVSYYYHLTQYNELIKVYNTDFFRKKSPKSLCLQSVNEKTSQFLNSIKEWIFLLTFALVVRLLKLDFRFFQIN